MKVELEDREWQAIVNILANTKEFPWIVTNPLLTRLGDQLRNPRSDKVVGPMGLEWTKEELDAERAKRAKGNSGERLDGIRGD